MRFNKYKNKKIQIDNIKFDSKKEAERYIELKLLEKAGKISGVKTQYPFILQEKYIRADGKKIREIKYIADFVYYDENNNLIVEDTKGYETEVFKIKRKLLEYKYNIVLKII